MISSLKYLLPLALLIAVPAQAGTLVERSAAALNAGSASSARALAKQAVAAEPASGLAHAMLARAALAEGDGDTAEGEIARANDAGFPVERTHHLFAHARLLQGDAAGALAAAKSVAPRYWTYGLRIQARALAAMGNPGAANEILKQAVERSPRDSDVWTDIGKLRQQVGDTVGAIEASTQAVALNGNDIEALVLRGQLVRTQFGLSAALPWFEAALKRDKYDYEALIEYAATLGDAGRTIDMLAATRRVLEVRPGDAQGMYLLSVLAARAGNTDLARALLDRSGGAQAGLPGPLLVGAVLDLEDGANEQAVAKLRNLIAIQPMNIRARQLLGVALLRTGATRDAIDVLRPVAARGDADSYTLTLMARAYEAAGDRARSAIFLDRSAVPARDGSVTFGADDSVAVLSVEAQGDDPGAPGSAVPLIRALLDSGQRDGALARARAVSDANRGSAAAAVVLGDTLMELGRAGEAADVYRRAATIAFDEPTMLRLTEALEAAGRRADAANALALFLSQNPDNVAALRLAAHWQIAAGDHQAAIDTLEGLRARIGGRDAALLAELAYAYDGAGEDAKAASYAAAAYALAPSNPAAADAYGWALRGQGDLDGALQLLQKAVAIAPRHAMLRWHLAQVYADLGRGAEAKAHATAALSDPRFGDRDAAQQLVASLG